MGVIAKGARQSKSKYGTTLQPMSYVYIVLYKKEGRELQTLSQCDVIKFFRHLTEDLDKMAVGMSMIELVAIVAHEQEENSILFKLLVDSLTALNTATKNPQNLFYYFEIRLSEILGFQPKFDKCISCRSILLAEKDAQPAFRPALRDAADRQASILSSNGSGRTIQFHLPKGGPLCRQCVRRQGEQMTLSFAVFRTLLQMTGTMNVDQVQDITVDKSSAKEIERFLWQYLQYHVSGMRELRSKGVFSKILQAS